MKLSRIALIATCLAGCRNPVDFVADGAVELTPPALYRELWQTVEACSGLTGNFDSLRFYLAPNGMSLNGESVAGLWEQEGNKIFLEPPYRNDRRTIMHEEMHALLRAAGHPVQYFNGACGDLLGPALN